MRPLLFAGLALLSTLPAIALAEGVTVTPSAYLQYDWVDVDSDASAVTHLEGVRRKRAALAFAFAEGITGKLDYDIQGNAWADLYLSVASAGGTLTAGQFKVPFGADGLASDKQLMLAENSVAAAFAPGRRLGLHYTRAAAGWGWAAAVYGRDTEGTGPDRGIAARGWLMRGSAEDMLWHGALAATDESPQDDRQRFRVRPELGPMGFSWLDSGTFAGVERVTRLGIEAGLQRDAWLLLAEWFHADLHNVAGNASGGYLQAGWAVYGEPRVYDKGLFALAKPGDAWLGMVELVARYSTLDLPSLSGNDLGQRGWALGVNAQVGRHVRLMLDRYHSGQRPADADAQLWTLRAQIGF